MNSGVRADLDVTILVTSLVGEGELAPARAGCPSVPADPHATRRENE